MFYPDGRLVYDDALNDPTHTRIRVQQYEELAEQLVRGPSFGPWWSFLPHVTGQPATTIWTEYLGTHSQITFPTLRVARSRDSAVDVLNGWANLAAAQGDAAVARERQKTVVARLNRVDKLQRVSSFATRRGARGVNLGSGHPRCLLVWEGEGPPARASTSRGKL